MVKLSRNPINYTGLEKPDIAIVLTEDGLIKIKDKLDADSKILADSSLKLEGYTDVTYMDLTRIGRKEGAILSAITYWMIESGLMPKEAFVKAASVHKYADILLGTIETEEVLLDQVG